MPLAYTGLSQFHDGRVLRFIGSSTTRPKRGLA